MINRLLNFINICQLIIQVTLALKICGGIILMGWRESGEDVIYELNNDIRTKYLQLLVTVFVVHEISNISCASQVLEETLFPSDTEIYIQFMMRFRKKRKSK